MLVLRNSRLPCLIFCWISFANYFPSSERSLFFPPFGNRNLLHISTKSESALLLFEGRVRVVFFWFVKSDGAAIETVSN